jgi:hypothetical protein
MLLLNAKNRKHFPGRWYAVPATVTALALLATGVPAFAGKPPSGAGLGASALHDVVFHGLQVAVPADWTVVDLTATPDACLRLDKPAIFLGPVGDQSACPAHLIGGAPVLHLDLLSGPTLAALGRAPLLTLAPGADPTSVSLPSAGPVGVAVEGAGVLATATYAPDRAAVMRRVVAGAQVLADAQPGLADPGASQQAQPLGRFRVPGTYIGKGFDTCGAPSQELMDAWRQNSDYASIGVYIGGISRGCSQPNLTPAWVAAQVANGWHLIPTYVGRQAPCSGFHYRVSYDPDTAFSQGSVEAQDAVADAQALGMVAPSTIYNDMEGYNNSLPRCKAGVLSYLSGWTHALHSLGYQSAVYSSASSGISDLSENYDGVEYRRPDDIWMAWWNGRADVDGGGYVPDSQWSTHRRDHQSAGNVRETYGGHALLIDRDYLDVSVAVPPPRGCPTNLDLHRYPMISPGAEGPAVRAAQCLLARAGFDPGVATGIFGWRMASALRAFKDSRGMNAGDSSIRRWAWTAIASAGPQQFLSFGVQSVRVRKVQRALRARLQRAVPITGYFGGPTRRAVLEYQRLRHMRATGTVGVPTWGALKGGL